MVDIQLFGRTVDSGLFFSTLTVLLGIIGLSFGYLDRRKKSTITLQNCTINIQSINYADLDKKNVVKNISDCITKNIPEISGAVTKDVTFELSEDKLKLLDAVSDKVGQYSKFTGKTVKDADILRALGTEAYYMGEPDDAFKYYSEALKIDEEQNNLKEKAIDLNDIGLVYKDLGKPEKALENYNKALAIAEELNDIRNEATYLNNIGLLYKQCGGPEKALEYYDKALTIVHELKDIRGKAIYLDNIGMLYLDGGEPEKALEYLQKALAIDEELKNIRGKARHLNNIGGVYNDWGKPEKALEYFQNALELFEELKDARYSGFVKYNIKALKFN